MKKRTPISPNIYVSSQTRTKCIVLLQKLTLGASLLFSATITYAATAPIYGLNQPNKIPGQYIVVLKNTASIDNVNGNQKISATAVDAIRSKATQKGFSVKREFQSAIQGFTIKSNNVNNRANDDSLLTELSNDPNVAFIEADQKIYASQLPWGLDRINQRQLPLDNFYTSGFEGFGVDVYVLDTGIRADHVEFGTRVRGGANFTGDTNGLNDCNGHGSHVAGTIGGATVGVAKSVDLWSVRVLSCNDGGDASWAIAGIEWVINNRQGPSIINMSLGGGYVASFNQAVEKAVAAGITVVVSAGNDINVDACTKSPASAARAITVGSSGQNDARSYFSNTGACVDIFAPGEGIRSVGITTNNEYRNLTGTSMASPHVAGVAAIYLQHNPTGTPHDVFTNIITNGTASTLTGITPPTPNLLLHSTFPTGSIGFFASPRKDNSFIGSPVSAPPTLPWPSAEGIPRVLRETANQFCKENGYAAVETYAQYFNYGAQHKYHLYGTWSAYSGVAFQTLKDIQCSKKLLSTVTMTQYTKPTRNGVLIGTPQSKPSGASWPTDGAYGNVWRSGKQFCIEKGFIGVDYFYNFSTTNPASHTYYNGSSWASYSNTAFWELDHIRCFK